MRTALLVLSLVALSFLGRSPLAAADEKKPPQKKSPLDAIEGYERKTIEGFTIMVSREVLEADVAKFERKPLDVLELELKTIATIVPPKVLESLRNVLVWVEWNESTTLANGRVGQSLAVYYGGQQQSLLQRGMQPLKSKSVTVLSMKSLTQEHQPKTDAGRCVLLHEFSHAVHDQFLGGGSNPNIQSAYKQGMERKLYDKELYVSTNDQEFFAELSCAYYDQLSYYPRTRDELKKHDPTTYRLMESIWGATAKKPGLSTAKKPLSSKNGSDKFDLEFNRSKVKLGEVVHGPSNDKLDGRVVVIGFWSTRESLALRRLVELDEELKPYGLTTIVAAGFAGTKDEIAAEMTKREVGLTTVERAFIPQKGESSLSTQRPPHTLVFDPDGTCVFRGSVHDAAPHARAAVGRLLLSKLKRTESPKSFAPVAEMLTSGSPPLEVIPKLTPIANSSDAEAAADAKALHAALTAPGQAALDAAAPYVKTDPLKAFLLIENLPAKYKGTLVAVRANALVEVLKLRPTVATERQARALLEGVKKLDAALSGMEGSFDPLNPAYQTANAATISQLKTSIEQLKKRFPGSPAIKEAEKIGETYGGK